MATKLFEYGLTPLLAQILFLTLDTCFTRLASLGTWSAFVASSSAALPRPGLVWTSCEDEDEDEVNVAVDALFAIRVDSGGLVGGDMFIDED